MHICARDDRKLLPNFTAEVFRPPFAPQAHYYPPPSVTACSLATGQVCFASCDGEEAHHYPARRYRPPHRRAVDAPRREHDHRHQRRENRQRNRRLSPSRLELDPKAARARRPRERPPAYRLSHRAHARYSSPAALEPSSLRHALRAPHLPLLQNRFDEHGRDPPRRAGRAPRHARHCRGADGRARARRSLVDRGEIGWHHVLDSAAASDSPGLRSPVDAGCRPRRPRRRCGRTHRNTRYSLAKRPSHRRQEILRHLDRDARRARPHPLRGDRHRHEREPDENARRSHGHCHLAAHRDRQNSFAPRAADSVAALPRPLLQSIPRRRRRADSAALLGSLELFRGQARANHHQRETFTGTTAGLEPSGVLRVARDDGRGVEAVLSGDVGEIA